MTLLDLINNLPHWLQIVAYVVLTVWTFEMFLLPFKFNIRNNRLKELIDLQKDTFEEIKQKDKELDRTYLLLSQVAAYLLKEEQDARKK